MNDVETIDSPTAEATAVVPGEPEPRERPEFVAGLFHDMDAEAYHGVEAMSASGAKNFMRSPLHFRYFKDHPSDPTEAMELGTAVHCGVLEPHRFDELVVAAPKFDRRTKVGKEAAEIWETENKGRLALSPADFDRARRCIDNVLAHPAAAELLRGAKTEVSAFWMDFKYRVPCKARFDALNHGGIVDLKTTRDASRDEFMRTVASFKYHMQAAHYASGAEHVLDASPAFFAFIAIETSEPHGCAVYELTGNSILAGMHLINKVLGGYRDCRASHQWPCYPVTVESLQLPRWALRFE